MQSAQRSQGNCGPDDNVVNESRRLRRIVRNESLFTPKLAYRSSVFGGKAVESSRRLSLGDVTRIGQL